MKITKVERVPSSNPRANPYSGGVTHPEIERIIEEGKQRRQEAQSGPAGEQDDGGDDEGEDDDIWSGRDYGVPAGYVCGNRPPPLLRSTNRDHCSPVPLDSVIPPPPSGTAVATASGDSDDDKSSVGIYDVLARHHPNDIITLPQLAKELDLSQRTIRRYIPSGILPPSTKIGRVQTWFVSDLADWMKSESKRKADEAAAYRRHIRDKTE